MAPVLTQSKSQLILDLLLLNSLTDFKTAARMDFWPEASWCQGREMRQVREQLMEGAEAHGPHTVGNSTFTKQKAKRPRQPD